MYNRHRSEVEFRQARRAALLCLSDPDEFSVTYLQMAIDRMAQAFNELVDFQPDGYPSANSEFGASPAHDSMCAQAVRVGSVQQGYRWCVLFVDGEPVADFESPASVDEFTRQAASDGWKVLSPSFYGSGEPVFTPDGQPAYDLHFSRERSEVQALPAPARPRDIAEFQAMPFSWD